MKILILIIVLNPMHIALLPNVGCIDKLYYVQFQVLGRGLSVFMKSLGVNQPII